MNLGSVVVALLVILMVYFCARNLWNSRSSCSGGCSSCGGSCKWSEDIQKAKREIRKEKALRNS